MTECFFHFRCGLDARGEPEQFGRARKLVPLCILHSPAADKDKDDFRRALADHGEDEQRKSNFEAVTFPENISFLGKTFEETANFKQARFYGTADFEHCRFNERADFCFAEFYDDVSFGDTRFSGDDLVFSGAAFVLTRFGGDARFWDTVKLRPRLADYADEQPVAPVPWIPFPA